MGMSKKELMIGNYLKYPNSNPFKIELDDFLSKNFWSDIVDGIIQPLTLTKDWLLRLNFERDYLLEKLQKDDKKEFRFGDQKTHKFIRICWHPVGGFTLSYQGTPLIKVKFVHKLQNVVYELVDKELTIKE